MYVAAAMPATARGLPFSPSSTCLMAEYGSTTLGLCFPIVADCMNSEEQDDFYFCITDSLVSF